MAISTVYSTSLTNANAKPIVLGDRKRGEVISTIDHLAAATTSLDEIGDVMLFCSIPTNAVILGVYVANDDLDSNGSPTLTANVGLYYNGDNGFGLAKGAVVDADCIATAITQLNAAVTAPTNIRFEAANITTFGDQAWQLAGLTEDCGGHFLVGLTISAAAATAAAGDIVVRVDYI